MNTEELIRLLLPVIWAVVSTLIGLILYKTSSAFFEESHQREGFKRKIRLMGSVVIAALTYLALWQSTPSSLQLGVPDDSITVRSTDIAAASEDVKEAAAAIIHLVGCTEITSAAQCVREIELVSDRISEADRKLDSLLKQDVEEKR